MEFEIYSSDVKSAPQNCLYPKRIEVKDKESLIEAVKNDHVCAKYKDNKRSNENFISSNVLVMDVDNETDDEGQFVTSELMETLFPDISYALVPSRHHNQPKNNYPIAPRFHVYFPIDTVSDSKEYARLKEKLYNLYPFFDGNALDAARFMFGSDSKDIVWHEGYLTVDLDLKNAEPSELEKETNLSSLTIPYGSRNKTMSIFAGRVLKKFGNTPKAKELFLEKAKKCEVPLEDSELNRIWASGIKFYENKILKDSNYVAPDKYNDEFSQNLIPEDFSDIGEAKVIVRECASLVKYTSATGFVAFDKDRWYEDELKAQKVFMEFMGRQLADAERVVKIAEDNLIKAGVPKEIVIKRDKKLKSLPVDGKLLDSLNFADNYKKLVMSYRFYKNLSSTKQMVKSEVAIDVSEFDYDPEQLNTPTGTYDLRKGLNGLHPHDPSDLITKITECSPSEEGKDLWLDALDTFFLSDKELIDYVQLIVGSTAVGKIYDEHLIIAYGGGANGKSTFWNAIARVLGNYSGRISADALTTNVKRNTKPEVAELKGKRLIIASELEEGTRLNTGMVKQLSSVDVIKAEKKYRDPFEFEPSHTLVLYTNHLPKVGANDAGTWRRLIVIPFNAVIEGNSDIKNYGDYLFKNAGGYILTWIIEGAKKAIDLDFKFNAPKAVLEAVGTYKKDNDWLGNFINDYCDVGDDFEQASGEFYKTYRAKCLEMGEYIRSMQDFYNSLSLAGYKRHKKNTGNFICGLRLKEGLDFLD